MTKAEDTLQKSHDRLLDNLSDVIKCIRRFDLGDYSPMMDEIFDSEHAIKLARPFMKQAHPDWPADEVTKSPKRCRGIIEQDDGGAP